VRSSDFGEPADADVERLRLIQGAHGRTPKSLLAWWRWLRAQPYCDHRGPQFGRVLDELLARNLEIKSVLKAILVELPVCEAIPFLESCITATLQLSDERQKAVREARTRLERLQAEAASAAAWLAQSLEELQELSERSGYDAYPFVATSSAALLIEAGRANPLFMGYLKGPIDGLNYSFDLKYWPDVPEMLRVLESQLRNHVTHIEGDDFIGHVSGSGQTDAAVVRAIEELMRGEPDPAEGDPLRLVSWGPISELTNEHLAALLSVMTMRDWNFEKVKKARQRNKAG
jgi:hypothetical protein